MTFDAATTIAEPEPATEPLRDDRSHPWSFRPGTGLSESRSAHSLELFECKPRGGRVTEHGCATMHRAARRMKEDNACRTCAIGAGHAGMPLSDPWPHPEFPPGRVLGDVEVIAKRPFTFEKKRFLWVRDVETGRERDVPLTALRRMARKEVGE